MPYMSKNTVKKKKDEKSWGALQTASAVLFCSLWDKNDELHFSPCVSLNIKQGGSFKIPEG